MTQLRGVRKVFKKKRKEKKEIRDRPSRKVISKTKDVKAPKRGRGTIDKIDQGGVREKINTHQNISAKRDILTVRLACLFVGSK